MTTTSLFACLDVRGSQWQLGSLPPRNGRLALVGWRQIPAPVDGGVPDSVATTLARAMCALGRVTYLSSAAEGAPDSWVYRDDDVAMTVRPSGRGGRVMARIGGSPAALALLSTRRVEAVATMFDDSVYPWWMQGQVAVLSDGDAPPPPIDRDVLTALLDNDWPAMVRLGPDVRAIVRPGVDGDLAGIYTTASSVESAIINALADQCRRAAVGWAIVDEETFARQYTA